MELNKKLSGKKQAVKVETLYNVGASYPYVVKFSVGEKRRTNTFSTKFFATLKAKKVAKFFGIKPDLSFKPVIGDTGW